MVQLTVNKIYIIYFIR